jgi:hypothetical protein
VATQQAPAIKPSKGWIWLGALLILAGITSASIIAIGSTMALSKTVDNFARIRVPDDVNCRLIFTKPGTYTIYYEYQGDVARRSDDCQETGGTVAVSAPKTAPVGLDVTLTDDQGKEISSTRNTDDVSVSVSGHAGVAVRKIVIPAAGDYLAVVTGAGDKPFVLAVGRGATSKLVPYFLLAGLLGLLGFVIGLPMMLVTRSRRKKAKALVAAAAPAPGAWGQAPGVPMPTAPTWTPSGPPAGVPQAPTGVDPWAPSAPAPPAPPATGTPWAPPPPPQ